VGKVSVENGWQARIPEALPSSAFHIDFEHKRVTCPAGQDSNSWVSAKDGRGQPIIHTHFPRKICLTCPLRSHCTRDNTEVAASLFAPTSTGSPPKRSSTAKDETFKDLYAARAGIEGTLAQALRRSHLRHARYLGIRKTHLQTFL